MNNINSLRPVTISKDGKEHKGFFHRFVYQMHGYYSETKALVELDNGKLRYFDPYFVQFTDRKINTQKKFNSDLTEKENQESSNEGIE